MNVSDLGKEEILKFADALGMGYYRVRESGEFLEANEIARDIFNISKEEGDLSRYTINNCYIMPEERLLELERLKHHCCVPQKSTVSLRICGIEKLLSTICWYDAESEGDKCVSTLAWEISDKILFPSMFKDFPMGVYILDDESRMVHFNNSMLRLLGYNDVQKGELLGKNIREFYREPEKLEELNKDVSNLGSAQSILRIKDANNKNIELECFTEKMEGHPNARWGFIHDVTKRERYYRALDRMPTAYFYVEYDDHKNNRHRGKIKQCNQQFADILGVEDETDLLGKELTDFYICDEDIEEFFNQLDEVERTNLALKNYPFRLKRIDGQIVHITVDSHLIKENNEVIGREGTIRDITAQVELQKKVEEAQKQFKTTTEDVNKFIHTFLHPVVKFTGSSEMFYHVSDALSESRRLRKPNLLDNDAWKLGNNLLERLDELEQRLNKIDNDVAKIEGFKEKLQLSTRLLDYAIQNESEEQILNREIKDVALSMLNILNVIKYINDPILGEIISADFIEFLEAILLEYLPFGAMVLSRETAVMKRNVDALRAYIGMKKIRQFAFVENDLGKVLFDSIERFKPVFSEEQIEIRYALSGKLIAEFSYSDIDRVINNLLHNAFKYSVKGRGRFVVINANASWKNNKVEFFIENYGIPIKKEEIETGKVWEVGYRCDFAYLSDRDGTGIGLADCKDVVEMHRGTIKISSVPSRDDGNPPRYKVPYKTRVTVTLPQKQVRPGDEYVV